MKTRILEEVLTYYRAVGRDIADMLHERNDSDYRDRKHRAPVLKAGQAEKLYAVAVGGIVRNVEPVSVDYAAEIHLYRAAEMQDNAQHVSAHNAYKDRDYIEYLQYFILLELYDVEQNDYACGHRRDYPAKPCRSEARRIGAACVVYARACQSQTDKDYDRSGNYRRENLLYSVTSDKVRYKREDKVHKTREYDTCLRYLYAFLRWKICFFIQRIHCDAGYEHKA